MGQRLPLLRSVIAGNIRRLRRERNLTQEQLAHLAGLDRTYVGMVERCERCLTIDVLDALATALRTMPEDLVRERNEDAWRKASKRPAFSKP